jgi:hypothetical protein
MAIQTYGELKTEVANWLDREDQTSNIPNFIRLAEADIYRDLRCRHNEFNAVYTRTGMTIDGIAQPAQTAGSFRLLPQSYKEMKLVTWDGYPLKEISEQRMRQRLRINADAQTLYYAEFAKQLLFSNIIPDNYAEWSDNTELTYTYYGTESLDSGPVWQTPVNPVDDPVVEGAAPTLTQTDVNSTRLLVHAPSLYLAGSLMWAHRLLRETEKSMEWKMIFDEQRGLLDIESNELTGSTVAVSNTYDERGYYG